MPWRRGKSCIAGIVSPRTYKAAAPARRTAERAEAAWPGPRRGLAESVVPLRSRLAALAAVAASSLHQPRQLRHSCREGRGSRLRTSSAGALAATCRPLQRRHSEFKRGSARIRW